MSKLFAGLDVSTQSCKSSSSTPTEGCRVRRSRILRRRSPPIRDPQRRRPRARWKVFLNPIPRCDAPSTRVFEGLIGSTCAAIHSYRLGHDTRLVALDSYGNLSTGRVASSGTILRPARSAESLTEKVGGLEAMIEAVGNNQATRRQRSSTWFATSRRRSRRPRPFSRPQLHQLVSDGRDRGHGAGGCVGYGALESENGIPTPVSAAIHPDLMSKLPNVAPSDILDREHRTRRRREVRPLRRYRCGQQRQHVRRRWNGQCGARDRDRLGTSGTTFLEEPFIDPEGEIASATAPAIICPCCACPTLPTDMTRF